jgi:hypothetical protein
MEKQSRSLEQLLRDTCRSYRGDTFSSYQVYSSILENPKKNGRRRHYTLTYSQVKQRMARADYLEKIEDDVEGKVAKYKNKGEDDGTM